MNIHPAALIFPEMPDPEYQALRADIKEHGLLEPLTLCDGMLLDGRHRYRACTELGMPPRFEQYTGTDPEAFVRSRNEHRRHLTPEQREHLKAQRVQRVAEARSQGQSIRQIAEAEHVHPKTIERDLERVAPATPQTVTGRDGKQYPANRPSPQPHPEPEPQTEAPAAQTPPPPPLPPWPPDRESVALRQAAAAIDCLRQIPLNDPRRSEGHRMVFNYLHQPLTHE
jgi:hypothetical protein